MSGTSRSSELCLVGIARASLDELLVDHEDSLRQRGLEPWDKDAERAESIRDLAKTEDKVAHEPHEPQSPHAPPPPTDVKLRMLCHP